MADLFPLAFGKVYLYLRPKKWENPKYFPTSADTMFYHQHTKYLQFDWLMNTKYIAYLKAAYFAHNLIGCQLKICQI